MKIKVIDESERKYLFQWRKIISYRTPKIIQIDMLRITDVDYIKDYELLLTFSDGQKKKVDLQPYLTGEVFGELLDLEKFIQYGLTTYTIEWANGADLAPEFLYEIGTAA